MHRATFLLATGGLVAVSLPSSPGLAAGRCDSLPAAETVARLDDESRTSRSYEAQRPLREFALYSYRSIANDLVDGRGPYLEALSAPFAEACPDESARLSWLRRMIVAAPSSAGFARRMGVALALVRGAT